MEDRSSLPYEAEIAMLRRKRALIEARGPAVAAVVSAPARVRMLRQKTVRRGKV